MFASITTEIVHAVIRKCTLIHLHLILTRVQLHYTSILFQVILLRDIIMTLILDFCIHNDFGRHKMPIIFNICY